jgi:hypothetical protein
LTFTGNVFIIQPYMTVPRGESEQGRGANNPNIQPGVRPATQAFLDAARGTEAYQQLDPRSRRIIDDYYSSPVSLKDLTSVANVRSETSVRKLIRSSLTALWQDLSPELQATYPAEEVILFKTRSEGRPLSEETRRKISVERRARDKQPMSGRTLTEEARRKMSEAHKGMTPSPEARRSMSEAQKRRWQRVRQEQAQSQQARHEEGGSVVYPDEVNAVTDTPPPAPRPAWSLEDAVDLIPQGYTPEHAAQASGLDADAILAQHQRPRGRK